MLSVARKSVDHGELPKEGEDGWEKNSGESLIMTHFVTHMVWVISHESYKNSEGILVKTTGTGTVTMNIRPVTQF